MKAPKEIKNLVENFENNIDSYKKGNYNEHQLRVEYVDPMFKALGWDIHNENKYAESYKDVIHEFSLKTDESTTAPDYCFRIGGVSQFFLETKKPSIEIKDDIAPAFQVRRYGWSAKLSLSILTDFEEFAIYDCKIKPKQSDKASVARLYYCTYKDYIKNWEEIHSLFSKESVLKGSFDKYTSTKKKGTSEVDKAFLEDMERWRDSLARNIALRNKNLSTKELNHLVQATIDRIVFLRICEDRNIEEYGQLQGFTKKANIYKSLCELYQKADDKYNSGLFHFKEEKIRDPADTLSLKLSIDDKVLSEIITHLYYPESPYVFSKIPAEILGQVYEKFLGKVIRLTPSHQAKVEEKPEVRKAGGVYYTPKYIVDYIVKNTVGELLKDRSPNQAKKLKILDPACGSGSFLIGAYQFLLDWYLEQYQKEPKKYKNKIYEVGKNKNEYKLSTQEKKDILTSNIYGVDVDRQAVEVSKLSLLLKVLEGENKDTLNSQMKLFHERALPDLSHNIKCGNSLIGTDYFHGANLELFEREEMEKINAFDWDSKNGFADIMKAGGFDAVIGNPPYVRIQALNEYAPKQVNYYNKVYQKFITGNYDIYILFSYKGYSILRKNGLLGFILPHKFFQGNTGIRIRHFFSNQEAVKKIIDFSTNQIFENATTYTCLFFLSKKKNDKFYYKYFSLKNKIDLKNIKFQEISTKILNRNMWNIYPVATGADKIIQKIKSENYNFENITDRIFKGSSTGNDKVFLLKLIKNKGKYKILYSSELNIQIEIESDILKPFLFGENVRKYFITPITHYLLFPYSKKNGSLQLLDKREFKETFPKAFSYLEENKNILLKRKISINNNDFYKYSAARSLNYYSQVKILIPDMLIANRIGFDSKGEFYHGPAIHSVVFNERVKKLKNEFFIGILNSNIFWFYIINISTALRGNAYRLTPEFLNSFPFPRASAFQHDRMVQLVDQMLKAQKKLHTSKNENDKKHYQQKVDILDKQIDNLVYELYELTKEEIKIVEGG